MRKFLTVVLAAVFSAGFSAIPFASAQNLVDDGDFDDPTLSAWAVPIGSWNSSDVNGSPTSGSLRADMPRLADNAFTVVAQQCVALPRFGDYVVSAQVWTEEYYYPASSSFVSLFLYFDESSCTTQHGSFGTTGVGATYPQRLDYEFSNTGGTSPGWVLIELLASDQLSENRVYYFDEVILEELSLFSDGFESGNTSIWSSTTEPVNLLQNSDFDSDIAGWTIGGAVGTWQPQDSVVVAGSGSILLSVTNLASGWKNGGAYQEFPVVPSETYRIGSYIRIPAYNDLSTGGGTHVSLGWYQNADCTGYLGFGYASPDHSQRDVWQEVSSDVTVPSGAACARFDLHIVADLASTGTTDVQFDKAFLLRLSN